jgi:hypothetical protein
MLSEPVQCSSGVAGCGGRHLLLHARVFLVLAAPANASAVAYALLLLLLLLMWQHMSGC